MTNEEKFVNELIGYIFTYPEDDYMTMECLCRKLHKYGLIKKKDGEWTTDFVDRKTENCSEIPNNSTISKMEQVEDEPRTDNGIGCSRCEGRFECYDRDMPHAVRCNNYGKITDEPQTERSE